MPAIFISHSSLDPQIADDIKTALDRLGFEKVFLDFNKETGIAPVKVGRSGFTRNCRVVMPSSWC
jgi:hypothetical protein